MFAEDARGQIHSRLRGHDRLGDGHCGAITTLRHSGAATIHGHGSAVNAAVVKFALFECRVTAQGYFHSCFQAFDSFSLISAALITTGLAKFTNCLDVALSHDGNVSLCP